MHEWKKNDNNTGQIFVKWVSSSIAKSFGLGEIELKTVEQVISEVCTHLIAAGVLKEIVDGDDATKDAFCVSQLLLLVLFLALEWCILACASISFYDIIFFQFWFFSTV